jgi:hypothetical protein
MSDAQPCRLTLPGGDSCADVTDIIVGQLCSGDTLSVCDLPTLH